MLQSSAVPLDNLSAAMQDEANENCVNSGLQLVLSANKFHGHTFRGERKLS
jgi:hypothetical protein